MKKRKTTGWYYSTILPFLNPDNIDEKKYLIPSFDKILFTPILTVDISPFTISLLVVVSPNLEKTKLSAITINIIITR